MQCFENVFIKSWPFYFISLVQLLQDTHVMQKCRFCYILYCFVENLNIMPRYMFVNHAVVYHEVCHTINIYYQQIMHLFCYILSFCVRSQQLASGLLLMKENHFALSYL